MVLSLLLSLAIFLQPLKHIHHHALHHCIVALTIWNYGNIQ
jgi:hypothetical protein